MNSATLHNRTVPSPSALASSDADGTVRLWDPATGQPIRAIGLDGGVNKVAFGSSGKLLVGAAFDGTVRLWDPASGQPIGTPLQTGANRVDAVAFSPNGQLLASAQVDGTVRLWRVSLFTHPYEALCTYVGPPTPQDWHEYAAGEPQPQVCT